MHVLAEGALAGWKRHLSPQGVVLTLQIAGESATYSGRQLPKVILELDDSQLKSFARDLSRAAKARRAARRPWWKALIMRRAFQPQS